MKEKCEEINSTPFLEGYFIIIPEEMREEASRPSRESTPRSWYRGTVRILRKYLRIINQPMVFVPCKSLLGFRLRSQR